MNTFLDQGSRPAPDDASREVARRGLSRAWAAAAVSLVAVLLATAWSPGPGGPFGVLVVELAVVALLGLGSAVAAVWWSARSMRLGRGAAVAPLVVGAFLVLQAMLRMVGTVGRFYGWD